MKNTTNTTPASNSIINVVVNGMTATEAVKNVQSRIETVEKSIFNIALITAYGTGVTIPAYTDNKGIEHGEATIDKPMKQADFIKLVGRSRKAISRWVIAMKLIIDNNYFTDFASGKYPFSYDKIITIMKEENKPAFDGMLLSDLMNLSAVTLETMVSDYKPANSNKEKTSTDNESTSADSKEETTPAKEDVEVATISYTGKEYKVPKVAFEKWLAENMIAE